MQNDYIDIPYMVAIVGPVFYAQVHAWFVAATYPMLILTSLGMVGYTVREMTIGDKSLFNIFLAFLGVVLVMMTLYQPKRFASLSEYAPVSQDVIDEMNTNYGNGGPVQASMPWPSYLVDRVGAYFVGLSVDAVRRDNRFIIPQAQAVAEEGAAQSSSADSQFNGASEVWRQVIGPNLLSRYPGLRSSLEQANLSYRFMNPASIHGADPQASQTREVVRLLQDAGVDWQSVLAETTPRMSAHLQALSPWDSTDSVLDGPLVSASMRAMPIAQQAPANSSASARNAFEAGKRVLDGVVTRTPASSHGSAADLYTALGVASEYVVAKEIGRDAVSVIVFGSACARDARRCRASISAGRDLATAQRSDVKNSFGQTLVSAATSVGLAAPAALSWLKSGVVVQSVPFAIGYTKAVIVFLLPIALFAGLIAGYFQVAVFMSVTAVAFVNLWHMLFILYMGFGEPLLSSFGSAGTVSGWIMFSLFNVAILAGMVGVCWSIVTASSHAAHKLGAGTTGSMGQAGAAVADAPLNRAVGGVTGRATQAAGQALGRASSVLGAAAQGAYNSSMRGIKPPPGAAPTTPPAPGAGSNASPGMGAGVFGRNVPPPPGMGAGVFGKPRGGGGGGARKP